MASTRNGWDFDAWSHLARTNPEAFEVMRRAAIEELINAAPPRRQERLRRLQWRVDQERRLAGSPLGACIRISRMMWNSLLGPGGLRDLCTELADDLKSPTATSARRSAQVIPLKSRH